MGVSCNVPIFLNSSTNIMCPPYPKNQPCFFLRGRQLIPRTLTVAVLLVRASSPPLLPFSCTEFPVSPVATALIAAGCRRRQRHWSQQVQRTAQSGCGTYETALQQDRPRDREQRPHRKWQCACVGVSVERPCPASSSARTAHITCTVPLAARSEFRLGLEAG